MATRCHRKNLKLYLMHNFLSNHQRATKKNMKNPVTEDVSEQINDVTILSINGAEDEEEEPGAEDYISQQ